MSSSFCSLNLPQNSAIYHYIENFKPDILFFVGVLPLNYSCSGKPPESDRNPVFSDKKSKSQRISFLIFQFFSKFLREQKYQDNFCNRGQPEWYSLDCRRFQKNVITCFTALDSGKRQSSGPARYFITNKHFCTNS